ncbi:MAG: 50S ribosomal protein L30 [Bacteroidia bacterium]|nr:50S ribosomal protein L30 [Bacteroidia bacterium]
MAKIKLRQYKSSSGMPKRQLKTLESLGIRKMNQVIEVEGTPQVMGMFNKLKHLVKIEQ